MLRSRFTPAEPPSSGERPNDLATDAAGDDAYFEAWRKRELSRIEHARLTYLDYTGSALYPESVVRQDGERLAQRVLGNPHSENGPSREASADLEDARTAILEFVHASPDDYVAIVTANATAATRLVAESFPFERGSVLALTADNHNSVNGIREYAHVRGAGIRTVPLTEELRLQDPLPVLDQRGDSLSLFSYPAQSNFSGVRHSLSLVSEARERGWRVLLDAAAFVPTAELDLSRIHSDFVTLSLYKIAGYPSGVGALIARREALQELQRPWFSGGTVDWVSVQHGRHRLSAGAAAFEDGTVPFLALGGVRQAMSAVRDAGLERLARHLRSLTMDLIRGIAGLRHANGRPLVRLHGPADSIDRGATVAFSVYDRDGAVLPYWHVEAQAREAGLAVRGGCFCNPGCAESAFAFPERETIYCLDGLGARFTIPRFAECLGGRAVGAIRVSLGLGSVRRDVDHLMEFLARYAGSTRRQPWPRAGSRASAG